jgi:hypothetical protein
METDAAFLGSRVAWMAVRRYGKRSMDTQSDRRLGFVQSALVLGLAFIVLGWLYLLLLGVREPLRPRG